MNNKILASFALVAITGFIGNQFFIRSMQSDSQDRGVANILNRNSSEQINWERARALEISKSDLISQNENPSWIDRLAFEYLAGKYDFTVQNGVVVSIKLKDNVVGQKVDVEDFLKSYGAQLVPHQKYKVSSVESGFETADLFNESGERVRSIKFQKDSQGHLQQVLID